MHHGQLIDAREYQKEKCSHSEGAFSRRRRAVRFGHLVPRMCRVSCIGSGPVLRPAGSLAIVWQLYGGGYEIVQSRIILRSAARSYATSSTRLCPYRGMRPRKTDVPRHFQIEGSVQRQECNMDIKLNSSITSLSSHAPSWPCNDRLRTDGRTEP